MSGKTRFVVSILALAACHEPFASPGATLLPNTAPVAYGQRIGASLNSPPKDITLKAEDADGDPLSFIIVSGPAQGTLAQVDGELWQYTRAANYQGSDFFRFKVNDGQEDSNVATVRIVNSPHGIFQLTGGTPWETNPNVDGLHLGVKWSDVATTEDVSGWNWSNIDSELEDAVAYNKQIGISLKVLSDSPAWLQTTYRVRKYLVPKDDGDDIFMVLPWDPVVKEKVIDFITELGSHITSAQYGSLPLDGTAAFVIMGGLGVQTETGLPGPTATIPHIPDPNNPSEDISVADEIALWQETSKDFIATYAASFRTTPFVIAATIPIDDDVPGSTTALTDVVCYGMGSSSPDCTGTGYKGFGPLFGVMQWGLNDHSSTSYIVNEWISTNSPTNPTGFQFGSDLGGDTDPSPILDQAVELNAHFVEVYSSDADGEYAEVIHRYSRKLAW